MGKDATGGGRTLGIAGRSTIWPLPNKAVHSGLLPTSQSSLEEVLALELTDPPHKVTLVWSAPAPNVGPRGKGIPREMSLYGGRRQNVPGTCTNTASSLSLGFRTLSGRGPIKEAVPEDMASVCPAEATQPLVGPRQPCGKLVPHSPCERDEVHKVESFVRKLP